MSYPCRNVWIALFYIILNILSKYCFIKRLRDIHIFDTKIPNSIKVGESDKAGKSILEYMPENPVSLAYVDFAKEVKKTE